MRKMTWTGLAFALVLVGGNATSADDIVRLGGPGVHSDIQGGTDTELIRGFRGGFYGGGRFYGGYFGGGHRFYGGFHGGFYGGGFRFHGARHFGGFYARPVFYSSFYSRPYYYQPTLFYSQPLCYSDSYYYPIAGDSAPVATLQGNGNFQQAQQTYSAPSAAPLQSDGTFPYDGGPRQPVPQLNPSNNLNPMKAPGASVPLEGRLVKLPMQTSGGVSTIATPDTQRLRYVATTNAPVRVAYPAYGDEPIVPATRKAVR